MLMMGSRWPGLLLALMTLLTTHTILAQEEDIINSTTSECEEVLVPMCRGLVDYNFTRLPNRFNHTTQNQVFVFFFFFFHAVSYFFLSIFLTFFQGSEAVSA